MEKILIISYFFKPCNMTAANRTTYWSENFYRYNLYPIVITRKWEKEINVLSDSSHKTSIGINLDKNERRTIYYLPYIGNIRDTIINKYGVNKFKILRKALSFIELFFQNFFIYFLPYNNFYQQSRKILIEDKEIKKIIISGNPFQQFFIGYLLKKEFDYIKWIADYRDEWTTHEVNSANTKSKFIHELEKRSEKKWTSNTSCITYVNEYQLSNITDFIKKTGYSISNGYESDDIPLFQTKADKLIITYSGTLYSHQKIEPFAFALRKLDKEISGLNIQINLIGVELVEGTKERILKEFKGLEKYLYISKRIPKNEVEIVMANSDALIVLQGMNNIIDSKVYDYLPFQKPIILCSNTNHLLISLLNDTKLGVVAKDEKELYDNLKDLYYKKQNNIPLLNDVNLTEIKKYSREAQTAKLANIIKNL